MTISPDIKRIALPAALAVFTLLLTALGPSGPALAAEPARVAVLPPAVNSTEDLGFVRDALFDMLSSRVGSTEGIELVRQDLAREAAAGVERMSEKAAAGIGKDLDADFVLFGSLTVLGDSVSLDARLLAVATGKIDPMNASGKGLGSVVDLADRVARDAASAITGPAPGISGTTAPTAPSPAAPAPLPAPAPAAGADDGEEKGFIRKAEKGPADEVLFRSPGMEGLHVAFASGDLDGDSAPELFIITRTGLKVARIESGTPRVVETIETKGRNVSVDIADADGDGAPEVYVANVLNNRAESFVVEYKGGGYTVTERSVDWLTRAYLVEGETVLAGQGFRAADGFHGPVVRLTRGGGKTTSAGTLFDPPRKADIYRAAPAELTDAPGAELAVLAADGRLRVYEKTDDGWKEAHRTADEFGGTLDLIETTPPDISDSDREFIPVALDPAVVDTDGDGRPELLVRRNAAGMVGRHLTLPKSYREGTVVALAWDRAAGSLVESWTTREVSGYIADYSIADMDGDGSREITLLVVEGTEKMFGDPESYVLSIRLGL